MKKKNPDVIKMCERVEMGVNDILFKEREEIKFMADSIAESMAQRIIAFKEDSIIKGLAKKGYSFHDREDLVNFIKSRCKADILDGSIVYFVDNIPFLKIATNSDSLLIKMGFNDIPTTSLFSNYPQIEFL